MLEVLTTQGQVVSRTEGKEQTCLVPEASRFGKWGGFQVRERDAQACEKVTSVVKVKRARSGYAGANKCL